MGAAGASRRPQGLIVDVEAGGRRHALDVRREGDHWLVTLNGRQVAARVTEIGGRWSLLLGPPERGPHKDKGPDEDNGGVGAVSPTLGASGSGGRPETGRSYEVSIEPGADGELLVHVDGHTVAVASAGRRGRGRRRSGGARGAIGPTGPDAIVSPMPGRIVKVLVRPGDLVEPRQGLVVVEAMKMENELRAARSGTVTDVRVTEGMSVEAGAVLVVLS